jgi:hypothetical protein
MKQTNPECPKCKSHKTISDRAAMVAIGFGCMGCLGPIFLVIFFPIAFLMIPMAFFMFLAAALHKGKGYTCQACQFRFEA